MRPDSFLDFLTPTPHPSFTTTTTPHPFPQPNAPTPLLCRRLKTMCTANAVHAIPFYHKVVMWENESITTRQMQALLDALEPGHDLVQDDLFLFCRYVCAKCKKGFHYAYECPAVCGDAQEESPLPNTDTDLHRS